VQEAEEEPETPAGKGRGSARGRLAAGLLSLSLIANAFLAAALVADTRTNQTDASFDQPVATASQGSTSRAARGSPSPGKTQTRSQAGSTKATPRVAPRSRSTRVPGVHRETNATVERKILALVIRSPERLPTALIDRSTGLPENNLQATCRASSDRSFLCVVRPARHKPNEGLRVRYRPGRKGGGRFTWYRYQHG
jgi:hypothetical protein